MKAIAILIISLISIPSFAEINQMDLCDIKINFNSDNQLSFGEAGELDADPRLTANILAHEENTSYYGCMDTRDWPEGTTPFYDTCVTPSYYEANSPDDKYKVDYDSGDSLILVEIASSEYVFARFLYREADSGPQGIIALNKKRKCQNLTALASKQN